MNLFKKKKYISINTGQTATSPYDADAAQAAPAIPDGMWLKCGHCRRTVYAKELGEYKKCPECGGYFRLPARSRISMLCDGAFDELDAGLTSKNPLDYPDYEKKLKQAKEKTGLNEAAVTGVCTIKGERCVVCVMDPGFIMGSMGSVVGEKITRAFEYAAENGLPVVAFTASGGARMQEGIISLMQMAKVSAAVERHSRKGLLYITVITDPTTGGVTASFAMLGDIILAEPGSLIGFAGRRVIEQTIKQRLPDDFQTAEFLMEHGFVDKIVNREDLRDVLASLLMIHG